MFKEAKCLAAEMPENLVETTSVESLETHVSEVFNAPSDSGSWLPDRLAVGGQTDRGNRRAENQDMWRFRHLRSRYSIAGVADGIGGRDWGKAASRLAIHNLFNEIAAILRGSRPQTGSDLGAALVEATERANTAVLGWSQQHDSRIGTTLCAALLCGASRAHVINVGDSRAYLLRDGTLRQVTQDHTLAAYLAEFDDSDEREIARHPGAHMLVRTIGGAEDVDVDLFDLELEHGDSLLLCSDGLWNMVGDPDLQRIMRQHHDPEHTANTLVHAARMAGGYDNITAVVIRV